jgi:hypothetical protein
VPSVWHTAPQRDEVGFGYRHVLLDDVGRLVHLLGFWWVVVQFRHDDMTLDRGRRLLAFVVSLHFILPGLMSLGALLTGDAPLIWRLTSGRPGSPG